MANQVIMLESGHVICGKSDHDVVANYIIMFTCTDGTLERRERR